jgi:LacI family transcriptional regulator
MAQSAIYACYEHGLRVPEDISIIGFDDNPTSKFTLPSLTTVRHDNAISRLVATEYLVSLVEKPDTPIYQQVLLPELILRSSTAPARER